MVHGFGEGVGLAVSLALLQDDTLDSRNDFACFFDHHGVAETDVFALDFFLVVEGGARDGGAGNKDGIEFCYRGEHSCAADLNSDGAENSFFLLGQELVSTSPSREAGGGAELSMEVDVVDLDDGPVGGVGEVVSVLIELGCGF